MSHYKEKTNKPKYVEKGTKYVQKGEDEPKKGTYVQKKTHNSRYRQKDTGGYDYDPSTITETTAVPKLPKKQELIPQPNQAEFKAREKVFLDEIAALKDKRKQIHNTKFVMEKHVSAPGSGSNVYSQYEKQYEQMIRLRDERRRLLDQIKPRKTEIGKLTQEIDIVDNELRLLEGQGRGSKQALEGRLQQLKATLVKGALSPKDEKAINHQIEMVKKELGGAQAFEQIQIRRSFLREKKTELFRQRDILFKQKKPFNEHFEVVNKRFFEQNDIVKAMIDKFQQIKKAKQTFKQEVEKGREEFFDSKHQKKKEIDEEIEKVRDKIDQVWDEYDKKVQEYKKQDQFIKYVHWVADQKEHLLRKKEREEKKRQWEEREKERKQRQTLLEKNKPKKYTVQIKNCDFLIQYCERLVPKDTEISKVQRTQEKLSAEEIEKKMASDQQWKKEKEKGVTIIQSKKTREQDPETKPRKVRKQQNEAQKQKKPTNYTHDFTIRNLFESIKTLPPESQADIERVIKQLSERKAYYEKMNEQEGDAKEEKSSEPHPAPKENQRKHQSKSTRFQPKEEDFPAL